MLACAPARLGAIGVAAKLNSEVGSPITATRSIPNDQRAIATCANKSGAPAPTQALSFARRGSPESLASHLCGPVSDQKTGVLPMQKLLPCTIAIAAAIALQGCATILNDATQPVAFSSDPQDAIVSVDGAPMGRTPCTLPIARAGWDKAILFTHDGYKPLTFTLKNSLSGAVAGNILLGGIIGGVVDGISGRGGGYQESVQVVLARNSSPDESRVVEVDFKAVDPANTPATSLTPVSTVSAPIAEPLRVANPPAPPPAPLQIDDSVAGSGPEAQTGDEVEYRYTCRLADGALIFDSDAADGKPRKATVGVAITPKGLGLAMLGARAGMTRRATVAPDLAFGPLGRPESRIPPNAVLVFEIRVVAVHPRRVP